MRFPTRPYSELDDLPSRPGVYIVWSMLSEVTDRPLYIGMTKRDVHTRMREHNRDDDYAVPFLPQFAKVEFRPAQNGIHARAIERELHARLRPHFGTGRTRFDE
jgi:excinuclease UvrABC nuclease subunit